MTSRLKPFALIAGVIAGCSAPPPDRTPPPDTSVEPSLSYDLQRGKHTYDRYCAVCHGATGEGDGFNAYNLAPVKPRDFTDAAYMDALTDERVGEAIRQGGPGVRRSVLMPAWGKTLSDVDTERVVKYIRWLGRTEGREFDDG